MQSASRRVGQSIVAGGLRGPPRIGKIRESSFKNEYTLDQGEFVGLSEHIDHMCAPRGNESGIPAPDQDLPAEVHLPGGEDHPNGEEGGDETSEGIPLSRGV